MQQIVLEHEAEKDRPPALNRPAGKAGWFSQTLWQDGGLCSIVMGRAYHPLAHSVALNLQLLNFIPDRSEAV